MTNALMDSFAISKRPCSNIHGEGWLFTTPYQLAMAAAVGVGPTFNDLESLVLPLNDTAVYMLGWVGIEPTLPLVYNQVSATLRQPILVFVCPKRQASFRFVKKGNQIWIVPCGRDSGIRTHTGRIFVLLYVAIAARTRCSLDCVLTISLT